MADFLQVFSTVDSEEAAERLAASLVERRLAACVQIVPGLTSVYRWQGKTERAREWLLLIKTSAAHYAELEAAIIELHPYECPEIVAVGIENGLAGYLDWLEASLAGGAK